MGQSEVNFRGRNYISGMEPLVRIELTFLGLEHLARPSGRGHVMVFRS